MKQCLGLIAALGLAMGASAATLAWGDTDVGAGSQTIFGSGDARGDFALAFKITTSFSGQTITPNAGMVTLGASSRDNLPVGLLAYSAEKGFGAHFDGSSANKTAWTDNASSLASGTHIVVLNGDWDATNNRWAMTLYIDGTTAVAFNTDNPILTAGEGGALEMTFAEHTAWTFDEAAIYSGMLTAGEIGELMSARTVIPEPTALALLALGVAGVALRRRAA